MYFFDTQFTWILCNNRDFRFKNKIYTSTSSVEFFLHRKEVIHPHVPVGIPCYDLTPITSPTLDVSLLTVRITASSITSSHGLTGGVYKPRERIHRDMADSRLLAIPASWSRVADSNPYWDRLYEICLSSRFCVSLYRPL